VPSEESAIGVKRGTVPLFPRGVAGQRGGASLEKRDCPSFC
jgi:hypothetical protein